MACEQEFLFFSFFFVLRMRGGKRTLIHHCWSSTHLPDDASSDDFSACLSCMKMTEVTIGCMDIYVQNKHAGIELV